MNVTLLGSGGFIPTARRDTACALVRKGAAALAIDAGSGVRRLVLEPDLLRGAERLHVVLTHFHLDHSHGLFYLADAPVPVEVWGAGEALEGVPTAVLVERLLGSPFAPPSFLRHLEVRELGVGETKVGAFAIRTRVQRLHSNPSLALRIDDEIAWCTDTAYDEENVAFVRGARVLYHEAFRPGETIGDPTHTGSRDAARVAAAAGVERLVLIHIEASADEDELLRSARKHFGATEVGRDAPPDQV